MTSSHPGYRELFPPTITSSFLRYRGSPEEIAAEAERLVETLDPETVVRSGEQSRRFAFERFRQDDLLVKLLNLALDAQDVIGREAAREAWSNEAAPIAEY